MLYVVCLIFSIASTILISVKNNYHTIGSPTPTPFKRPSMLSLSSIKSEDLSLINEEVGSENGEESESEASETRDGDVMLTISKTTSMANFYYKKSLSQEELLADIEKADK